MSSREEEERFSKQPWSSSSEPHPNRVLMASFASTTAQVSGENFMMPASELSNRLRYFSSLLLTSSSFACWASITRRWLEIITTT